VTFYSRKNEKAELSVKLTASIEDSLKACLKVCGLPLENFQKIIDEEAKTKPKTRSGVHWVGFDAHGRYDPEAVRRAERQRNAINKNRKKKVLFRDGNAKSFMPWWLPEASKKYKEQSKKTVAQNKRAETVLNRIKSDLKLKNIEWQSSWSKSQQVRLITALESVLADIGNKDFFEDRTVVCADKWSIPCAPYPSVCLMIDEPAKGLVNQMGLVFRDFDDLQTEVINLENELTHTLKLNVVRPIAFPNRLASGLSMSEYRDILRITKTIAKIENTESMMFLSICITPEWIAPGITGFEKEHLLNDEFVDLYFSKSEAKFVLSFKSTRVARNKRLTGVIHPNPVQLIQKIYKKVSEYKSIAESIKIERDAERLRETALRKRLIENFHLKNLKRDDAITVGQMNESIERLLENEKSLKGYFEGMKLVIGMKYFTWLHGNLQIPHDWSLEE
jgi:hypothetical protein